MDFMASLHWFLDMFWAVGHSPMPFQGHLLWSHLMSFLGLFAMDILIVLIWKQVERSSIFRTIQKLKKQQPTQLKKRKLLLKVTLGWLLLVVFLYGVNKGIYQSKQPFYQALSALLGTGVAITPNMIPFYMIFNFIGIPITLFFVTIITSKVLDKVEFVLSDDERKGLDHSISRIHHYFMNHPKEFRTFFLEHLIDGDLDEEMITEIISRPRLSINMKF